VKTGKPVHSHPIGGRKVVKLPDTCAGKGGWKKRKPICNEWDKSKYSKPKGCPLPSGGFLREIYEKILNQQSK